MLFRDPKDEIEFEIGPLEVEIESDEVELEIGGLEIEISRDGIEIELED
ncbi:hypothetical protein [Thermoflavimicrobium daqui]|jgi:hypothetical protein|nr:hypothetical protein [Thermoflavimicrobium daqui]